MKRIFKTLTLQCFVLALGLSGCVLAQPTAAPKNFEECVAAGNPMLKSYPARCVADGKTFVQEVERPARKAPASEGVFSGNCKSQCGDGTCQEIVCMAVGCPCPESPQTCPDDCKILR